MTSESRLGRRELCMRIIMLFSNLTTKTTANSRQTSPHISYIHIHTLRYKKIICIPLTKKIHKRNANLGERQLDNFDYRKLAIIS